MAIDNNVYKPSGYGNVFEELLNPSSKLNHFKPNVIFVIIDLSELIVNCNSDLDITTEINNWFDDFHSCNDSNINYFISDVDIRDRMIEINARNHSCSYFENIWNNKLEETVMSEQVIAMIDFGDKLGIYDD